MTPLHRPKVWVCKCVHCRVTDKPVRRSIKRGEAQASKRVIESETAQV